MNLARKLLDKFYDYKNQLIVQQFVIEQHFCHTITIEFLATTLIVLVFVLSFVVVVVVMLFDSSSFSGDRRSDVSELDFFFAEAASDDVGVDGSMLVDDDVVTFKSNVLPL